MDQGPSSQKSAHFHMRDVWQAPVAKRLCHAPRISLPDYRSLGFTSKAPSTKKKRKPLKYDTPKALGIKWQMDVKYVPKSCCVGKVPEKFYQYTMIDEASRERFIYPYVGIEQKLITTRTPWHNGKVERSHRNNQKRFYYFLSFYSFIDLKKQMYRYIRRSF